MSEFVNLRLGKIVSVASRRTLTDFQYPFTCGFSKEFAVKP